MTDHQKERAKMMDLELVRDRTTAIRAEYESTRKVDRLNSCIEALNMKFGGDDECLRFGIFNYSTDTVTSWGQTIPVELYHTAKAFFRTLDNTFWNDIASEDIKMAGELVSEIFKHEILYDSKTFTFYLSTDYGQSEAYRILMEDWNRLSWWRKLFYASNKPKLTLPQNIPASKAI